MADKKISELTAITGSNPAATDVFVVVDTSTGQTKKITREELNNAIEQDVLSSIDIDTINGDFTVNGNMSITGTVDGRDVSSDGTKLDGIEASATADQTAAEIKTAYESNSDTNEFSDAEQSKLAGIEDAATADQTGSEIATALTGETVTGLTSLTTTGAVTVGGDLTVNGTTTTINSTTLEVDDKNITLASGAADAAAADGAGITIDGASATFTYAATGDKWTANKDLDITGDVIVSGTVDGRDIATDGSKLDGIEASATADQTGAEIASAISGQTVATLTITSATINGGSISGITDLAVADGGTGASDAATARTNLDVDQAGTAVALAIALG